MSTQPRLQHRRHSGDGNRQGESCGGACACLRPSATNSAPRPPKRRSRISPPETTREARPPDAGGREGADRAATTRSISARLGWPRKVPDHISLVGSLILFRRE